jgi:hypothetical protein
MRERKTFGEKNKKTKK